ncbi:hypothetical protein ABPG72_017124 [Tetrahymena utriculariae]
MADQIYQNIDATQEPIVMESICVNCEENGETTMMLTRIPMFKEVILISFYCQNCGFKNTEVTFGGKINDYATKIDLKVVNFNDFKRDCVKSEHCTIRIPELDFEIPSTRKGSVNTIEGFLMNTIEDLQSDQEERKEKQPEIYEKIEKFIQKIQDLIDGKAFPFHFIFEDPSGNSFIKNPYAPNQDHNMHIEKLPRTVEQLEAMGYSADNAKQLADENNKKLEQENKEHAANRIVHLDAHRVDFSKPLTEDVKGESLIFKVPCHSCGLDGEQKMCTTSIPYFKELIVMSFLCQFCGTKSTEVKPGGEISKQGKTITLQIQSVEDLKRDLFKSETCSLVIPEIELELEYGTLGGVYTTVEGLLEKIEDNLLDNNPFAGDSADPSFKQKLDEIFAYLERARDMKEKCTIILKDLLDNSFIQNPYYPEHDPNVKVELFDRNHHENDILGLNDMKVENYGEKHYEETEEQQEEQKAN